MAECSEVGCQEPTVGRGLCRKHYMTAWGADRTARRRAAELKSVECTVCGTVFTPQRYRDGRVLYCSKKCKEVARRTSGRMALSARRHHIKSKYGLTEAQFEEMCAGGCGICGTSDWGGKTGTAHVDHNHSSGDVRGVLCHNCNMLLGHARDDVQILRRAIAYLTADIIP